MLHFPLLLFSRSLGLLKNLFRLWEIHNLLFLFQLHWECKQLINLILWVEPRVEHKFLALLRRIIKVICRRDFFRIQQCCRCDIDACFNRLWVMRTFYSPVAQKLHGGLCFLRKTEAFFVLAVDLHKKAFEGQVTSLKSLFSPTPLSACLVVKSVWNSVWMSSPSRYILHSFELSANETMAISHVYMLNDHFTTLFLI